MTAPSSSNRIYEARKALARYDAACAEPDDDPGYFKRTDAAFDLVEPLRALLDQAVTEKTPGQIAWRVGWPHLQGGASAIGMTRETFHKKLTEAVRAGIQAAHLSEQNPAE